MAQSQAIRTLRGTKASPKISTAVVPQISLAGPVLAILPAVYGISLAPLFTSLAWNPVEYAIVGMAFYLASVALAAVDEHGLRSLGISKAATAYWALLGPVPYLVARTRVLVDADRAGIAVLWVAISSTLAVTAALAVLALA